MFPAEAAVRVLANLRGTSRSRHSCYCDGIPTPVRISELASVVFLFGLFLVFDAIRWSKLKYPLRMARWENSYLCSRCSKVTIIEPVSEQ